MGGAAGDLIDVAGNAANAFAVVLGDNGTIRLSNAGMLLEMRSTDFASGAADTINLVSGTNTVIGGAGADLITSGGGRNTVLGDDGEAYFFNDGTIRLIQSINLGVGANDQITFNDGTNTVIGGFGADRLLMGGGTNYVMGDEAKLEVLTIGGVPTGQTVLESLNGSVGGIDDIDVGAGKNIVVGGAAGDLIDVAGNASVSSAVVVGDNGEVILSNTGTVLEVRSIYFDYGADDVINIVTGTNAVIGGRGGDLISVSSGSNIVFGDDAEAFFFAEGGIRLLQSINLGMGGNDLVQISDGNNKIIAGQGNDQISVFAGIVLTLGDEGRYEVTERVGTLATQVIVQTMNTLVGGNDSVIIAAGRAIVFGGGSSDSISTTPDSTGQVIAIGDGGEAVLDSQERPSNIRSIEFYSGGNDTVSLGNQDDIIAGGFGEDLLNSGEGNNIVLGDTVELRWELYGTNRVLTYVSVVSEDPASAGDDIIVARSGSDVLIGGNGSDTIDAGPGEDVLATHNASLYLPIPQVGTVSGWGMDQLPRILGKELSLTATEYFIPFNASGDIGDGTDILYGGNGNDFMLVTPGGHDTIYDLSGYDTISFQLAAQGVVFDLDYLNKRQYIVTPGLSGGISVTLMREEANGNRSSIENFVGSQYADVIFANPNTISRTFKGGRQVNHPDGRPGDELRLRTYGNQVVDSGNILSIAGLGSIYYYEFETLEWIDGTPMLFDDGDREWFDVGTGTKIKQPSLLGGDAYYSTATKSDTSNFAGWSFSKLTPGPYQISLSWPTPDPAFIYSPRVTVRDRKGNIEAQRQIDQKTEPVVGNYLGQKWYDFGTTIDVDEDRYLNLDYNSNNLTYFLADGMRVERIRRNSSEIRAIDIISGSEIASGLTLTDFGDYYFGSNAYRDFRIVNLGTEPLKLNLVDREQATSETQFRFVDGLVLEGAHRKSLPDGFLSAEIIYATQGASSVAPGQSATLRVYVDTQKPGYHFGEFLLETNDVNESVFKLPIAARVGSATQIPRFIDNQSAGFSIVSGTLTNTNQSGTYGGKQHVGQSSRKNTVRWTQPNLPVANYRISATWSALPLGDAKATYKVTWGNQTRTVVLSQQKQPSSNALSFRSDGVEWVDLVPSANISAGDVVRIELTGGAVLADAIRIQQIGHVNYPSTSMLELTDDTTGRKLNSRMGVWDFGSLQFGQTAQRTLTIKNTGNLALILGQEFDLGPGFKILNNASVARKLQPGESTSLQVICVPTTFGTLQSELGFQSNDAENSYISLVLSATVVEELIVTADDTTNFRMVGVSIPTGSVAPTGNAYSKKIAVGYNDGDSATWSFPNLKAGLYAVFATWDSKLVTSGGQVKPPMASWVPFVITGLSGEPTVTAIANQAMAADDQYSSNRRWEFLSDYQVTGAGLEITVQNTTAGSVIHADAVRVVRIQYPETRVQLDGKPLKSKSLINFGRVDQGESVTKTLVISNPSPTPLVLQKILEIPAGFTTDFQPKSLAPRESAEIRLTFTGDQRGWYMGDLLISTGDSYSGVFQASLVGEVMSPAMIVDDSDSRLTIVGNLPSSRSQATAYLGGSKGLKVIGDRGTWSFNSLQPGKYRVSSTWGSQSAAVNNARFSTTTSQGTVETTWDQVKSPSDYAGAFWDNDHWWVDLASEIVVGSNGILQVSAVHPGPSFREVTLDAIRVEKIIQPITGIPTIDRVESVNEYTSTVVRGNIAEGYRIDFGTETSPLFQAYPGSPDQRDYVRVAETTNYTYQRGYGWIGNAPKALDQGGVGMDLSYLLRDAVWDTEERLLRLDLPSGQYRFTFSTGDAWSWDPIAKQPIAKGILGQKLTKQFDLVHARGGAVLLSLKPEAGSDYWMLSSLDLQKISSVVTGSLVQVPGASPNEAVARATGAPIGMYTIDLDQASFRSSDADPSMNGHQVFVNASGILEVLYTINSITGTVEIRAKHDQGIAEYNGVFYNTAPSVNLRLDMNGSTSQTQAGYIAVPEKTWYTPNRGYGWQNPLDTNFSLASGVPIPPKELQWGERSWPSAFDQTNFSDTSFLSLLRDGHKHTHTKEFRTDLPDGIYTVTVTVGGLAAVADIDIDVLDQPAEGIANTSTLAGEFKRISFNATATRGRLILTFSSSIARSEWSVNAIEIRSFMNPISVSLSGGNIFEAARETPYSINTAVAPGLYMLSSSIGSITATDNDPRLSGIQATVGSNGQLSFQFRSEFSGEGAVLVSSLDGNTQYRIPVMFQNPLLRRLDFNHTTSPVNTDGYRSVLHTSVYDPTKAFGWSARTGSLDRTAAATNSAPQRLFQDKHTAAVPLYFMVSSEIGKTYDLRLHLGDTVARDIEVSINGKEFQRFSTVAGQYISPLIRTLATDQRIEIYIRGAGIKEWSINGLEVLEVTGNQSVQSLQPANDLIAGVSSSIQRNLTSSGQAIQPGTYWLTNNIGLVTNPAGLQLNQITVTNNGLVEFSVISSVPGIGTIRLDSIDGSRRYELPISFRLNPVRLYDFDHVNRGVFSPSASGYTRVLATNVYSQSSGFGWNSPVQSVDRTATARNLPTPTELYRDKHFNSTPGSFFVMSEAGKTYSVTAYFGDTEARSIEVSLDGGSTYERVTTAANTYTNRTWSVTATSDRVQILFRKVTGKNWSVNAIEVREQIQYLFQSSRTARVLINPSETLVGTQQLGIAPQATTDLAATTSKESLRINVLANDYSNFGPLNPASIQIVSQPTIGQVRTLEDGTLEYIPIEGYTGQISFAYQVRDQLGITSNYGEVIVNITDRVHQNFINPLDVNADSSINPLDVLLLIDRLNQSGSHSLANTQLVQNQWVDVNGNQVLDPLDVLQVIDYLNRSTDGSYRGEGEADSNESLAPTIFVAQPTWATMIQYQNQGELEVTSVVDPHFFIGQSSPAEDDAIMRLKQYLASEDDSLSDEEIADRLTSVIEFGLNSSTSFQER